MTLMGYPGWPLALSDELDKKILKERQRKLRQYSEGDGFNSNGVRLSHRQRHKAPSECIQCGKKFRRPSTSKDDFPGTILHQAAGRCSSCHDAHIGRRGRKK